MGSDIAAPTATTSQHATTKPSPICEVAKALDIDKLLVLDFGSQYSHLIVRRCRELGVYTELIRCDVDLPIIESFGPKGIILSGSPSSVNDAEAPHCCEAFWEWIKAKELPLLGVCYGLQEMCWAMGGAVDCSHKREYGIAELRYATTSLTAGKDATPLHPLFRDLHSNPTKVWMSHGDKVTKLPDAFQAVASTSSCEYGAAAHKTLPMVGLQFHPEVTHSLEGGKIIENFVFEMCQVRPSWNMHAFASTEIEKIREKVKDAHVLGALSGGVDSTVAAALLHKAIGDKFHGVLVDTGLLRKQEGPEVIKRLKRHIPGLQVECVDASDRFFAALKGVTDPEKKRKIIGNLFIACFEETTERLQIPLEGSFLLQGTLYPDVIESVSFKGPSATIKTHHNVGGLPEKMKLKVLEPLRELFKDEVRKLGSELGLDASSVWRHPFPGPGLAIRILGEVTKERADILREADDIYLEEIRASGDYQNIGQAFVVLLPDVKSVGVMGDQRTYEMACCVRAVATSDFMTADWYRMPYEVLAKISSRIINEVKGINRCCYDISSKPPATIEWE